MKENTLLEDLMLVIVKVEGKEEWGILAVLKKTHLGPRRYNGYFDDKHPNRDQFES